MQYGVQWDQTVRWLSKTNYEGIEKITDVKYGNFSSSVVNTGSNENYSLNNIYDMRGNVQELTMEGMGTTGWYTCRGAWYLMPHWSISFRNHDQINSYTSGTGFRFALYIK